VTTPDQRLRALAEALRQADGNALVAFRAWTGHATNETARIIGRRATDLRMCLGRRPSKSRGGAPRRYISIRRALEVEYNLPAYGLDTILDTETKHAEEATAGAAG
jgi:hypothetical protein